MIPMISRTSRIRPRQIKAPQNQGLLLLFAFFAFSSSSSERRLSTGVWRRLFMLAKLAWKFQSHRREGQLCCQFAAECSVCIVYYPPAIDFQYCWPGSPEPPAPPRSRLLSLPDARCCCWRRPAKPRERRPSCSAGFGTFPADSELSREAEGPVG